jgi:hypothetical protein
LPGPSFKYTAPVHHTAKVPSPPPPPLISLTTPHNDSVPRDFCHGQRDTVPDTANGRSGYDGISMSSNGKELTAVALCRICEPIAFMSIFPYAYYMVQDFGIAADEKSIAMYVGMVTSAFAFAECVSGIFWGRLSDRIGRKKVLLGGLFGTGLSMILFGFASNLPMALVARALGGLLNG